MKSLGRGLNEKYKMMMDNQIITAADLDALVAEKVMGCKMKWFQPMLHDKFIIDPRIALCGCPNKVHVALHNKGNFCAVKEYSTDMAAAWEVVEKILDQEERWFCQLFSDPMQYSCIFGIRGELQTIVREYGRTAPLAICLAALSAVGYELPQETA